MRVMSVMRIKSKGDFFRTSGLCSYCALISDAVAFWLLKTYFVYILPFFKVISLRTRHLLYCLTNLFVGGAVKGSHAHSIKGQTASNMKTPKFM